MPLLVGYNVGRKDMILRLKSGKSQSVTEKRLNPWTETCLPTLLSNYNLNDIYNADKFGLFFNVYLIKRTS